MNASERWQHYWFEPVPTHIYALLRIAFALVGGMTLVGVRDVSAFWDLNGMVPIGSNGLGIKVFLMQHGWGAVAGTTLYVCTVASFVSMAIGFRAQLSVVLALLLSLVQVAWNYLPLSGADAALRAFLFCLMWADCGSVWSVDAWLARKRRGSQESPSTYPIAPLRLLRFQVALIYLNAGLWKFLNPYWRDGSAVHYVLETNLYHRFPGLLPVTLDWLIPFVTYGTLFWELGFAFFVLFRPTRRIAIALGIALHVGMLLTIEIGPFHWMMLASYLAFLDPRQVFLAASRHVTVEGGTLRADVHVPARTR